MTRYETLLQLIEVFRPQSIIEVGTWNGANAIRMIKQAQKYHPQVKYTGYDLFEEATDETDAAELNVKAHPEMVDVMAFIKHYCPGADVSLIKGNTRETITGAPTADFVFIDGGHSVETVASDHAALKHNRIIVHDDYYRKGPDTLLYGCNELVSTIANAVVLPQADPVKGGGTTQLVLIVNG